MNKRLTLTIIAGLMMSFLVAGATQDASKPSLILSKADIKVIDNAIKSDFKNLSKADKKKLKSFLSDYAASVGQEKNAASTRGKAPSKKRKGIKKYKAGSIK